MRFDFLDWVTSSPSSGDCSNDTLTISGMDSASAKIVPTNLCGNLTGQHLYIDVADLAANGYVTFTITLSSVADQHWKVLVRKIITYMSNCVIFCPSFLYNFHSVVLIIGCRNIMCFLRYES